MANIQLDIQKYNEMKNDLEKEQIGKWVLIHDGKLIDIFETFEKAAEVAVNNFGKGPYLIRQIGAQPITLPISVMHNIL